MSKRLGSIGVEEIRANGLEPMALLSLLGRLGTSQPVEALAGLDELAADLDFAHFGRAPAHFDLHDVELLNARLLHRLEPDTAPLWREAELLLDRTRGLLVIDDTTLDKPYAQQIALVHRHWSGKHHRIVAGINLVTLVWSDDTHAVPCDYRLFDAPNDGLTKHDHFQAMLETAKQRGFTPRYVCFDGWYSSLANLKLIRSFGWQWLTPIVGIMLVTASLGGMLTWLAGP